MPLQTIELIPSGRVNRRDPRDSVTNVNGNNVTLDVLSRENFYVQGVGTTKINKKFPGSDRHITSPVGTGNYRWLSRYYSGSIVKSFGFNDGVLYHIAEDGTETSKVVGLEPTARPVSEIMKISSNNVMYFSDGFNGMYSHDGNTGHNWTLEGVVSLNFVGMASHLDRMFGFEEDSEDLHFSKNLDPTNYTDVDDAGIITIGAKRGAKIMNIAVFNEYLYIFKEDSMWVLTGRSPSQFEVREVHPSLGIRGRHSLSIGSNGMFFFGSDYEYYVSGGTQPTTSMLTYDFAIGGEGGNYHKNINRIINKEKIDNMESTFHNNLYRCAFTETGQTVNNLEYIYNSTNKTDGLTRGNNVSVYMVQDKSPDNGDLYTGRADSAHVMVQNRGLNWDNQATSPSMPIRLELMYAGKGIENKRFKKIWGNFNVHGAEPITVRVKMDTRLADSDERTHELDISGEQKTLAGITLLKVSNQTSVTSRAILKWGGAKGQTINIEINEDKKDLDLSIESFVLDVIVKERKRSKFIGV